MSGTTKIEYDGVVIEKFKEFPPELLDNLSLHSLTSHQELGRMMGTVLEMSNEAWYVHLEDGTPLLMVGAVRLNLLDPSREIWAYTSKYLTIDHMRACLKAFKEWLSLQTGRPIYARVKDPSHAKWIRFFGMTYVSTDESGIELYEVLE